MGRPIRCPLRQPAIGRAIPRPVLRRRTGPARRRPRQSGRPARDALCRIGIRCPDQHRRHGCQANRGRRAQAPSHQMEAPPRCFPGTAHARRRGGGCPNSRQGRKRMGGAPVHDSRHAMCTISSSLEPPAGQRVARPLSESSPAGGTAFGAVARKPRHAHKKSHTGSRARQSH
jgi:hypothetical protein